MNLLQTEEKQLAGTLLGIPKGVCKMELQKNMKSEQQQQKLNERLLDLSQIKYFSGQNHQKKKKYQ